MKLTLTYRSLLTITAAALASCAGAGSRYGVTPSSMASASMLGAPAGFHATQSLAAPLRHGWLSPAALTTPVAYVSDFNGSVIDIYPANKNNPAPVGQITTGIASPLGNYVDRNGTLYVANSSNGTVTEYPKGSTTPSVTLSNGISGPISVAVDRNGNVAVGEFANGTILEFPAGSSSPTVTITLLTLPEALAFDRTGHLYAAWNVNTGSSLVGHVSKCEKLRAVCVDQGIAEGQSGGLALDSAGNLILGDQTNHVINIYAPNTTSPKRTITTSGQSPYKFELNAREQKLYFADILTNKVEIYNYTTGTQFGTISSGLQSAWGVSLSPPAPYRP